MFLVLRHIQVWRNSGEMWSNVQPLSKVREIEIFGSVQDSPMERERIMSEHIDIHDFLEKKADNALKGELRSSDIVI